MNPTKDIDRDRLKKAMTASWDYRSGDRERYTRIVRKLAAASGTKRRNKGEEMSRPINLLRQSLETFRAASTGGQLRFYCEDSRQGGTRFAKIQQTHLNDLACEIGLSATLSTAVISSFFKEGIVELHRAESPVTSNNWMVEGRPFVSNIPWNDFGEDMTATHQSKVQFQYHFFDLPWDVLHNTPSFDRDVLNKMRLDEKHGYSYAEGRDSEDARTAFGFTPNRERLAFDTVRLVAVWVPSLKTRFFWPYRMDTPPLLELQLDDRDGPYRKCVLNEIPDNIMACSQAESLEILDDLHNSSWRKIASMINATRDLLLYEKGSQEDAENIRTAQHGKTIAVGDIDSIRKESFGGVSKNLAAASIMTSQWYDRMDNNLPVRAGLQSQAGTATEAELQAQAGGVAANFAMQKILEFYSSVGEGLRRMLWNDQSMSRDSSYEHPSLPGYKMRAPWRPGVRHGNLDDYSTKVMAYTIAYQSPAAKIAKTLGYIERLQASGLLQQFAQAGRIPDPDAILDMITDDAGPDIKRIFQIVDPVEPGGNGERPLQMRNKTSTQIRKSEAKGNSMMDLVSGMTE
jgi:hypothetical protein